MKRVSADHVFAALLADLGSDASRRGYTSDWTFFCKWLKRKKTPVLKVTPKDVKAYVVHLADKGQAQRTRGRALSVIRAVYGAFVAEELLKYNPAREVKNTKKGKTSKPVTWLEEDALRKMLAFGFATFSARPDADEYEKHRKVCEACSAVDSRGRILPDGRRRCEKGKMLVSWTDRRDRMCIQLLAGTGRRRAEVARMRVEDFTEHGVSGAVKGGAVKTAPVPEWLRRELTAWLAFAGIKSGPVLPRSPGFPCSNECGRFWTDAVVAATCCTGGRRTGTLSSVHDAVSINGNGVYAIVKRVAAAVGIAPEKISPHGLRRTLATLSERRNVPLADLQVQLGHASRDTTETYLKGSRKVEVAPGEWMGELVKR